MGLPMVVWWVVCIHISKSSPDTHSLMRSMTEGFGWEGGLLGGRMGRWEDGRVGGWLAEWEGGLLSGRVGGWVVGWEDGRVGGWLVEWEGGRVGRRVGGREDGRVGKLQIWSTQKTGCHLQPSAAIWATAGFDPRTRFVLSGIFHEASAGLGSCLDDLVHLAYSRRRGRLTGRLSSFRILLTIGN